jgi:hypothetical protein
MKTNPCAIPLRAKPRSTRTRLSGRPRVSEGPYKIIETASNKKEIKISSLLGTLPDMKFTKIQLIVYVKHGIANIVPFHDSETPFQI